MLPLNFYNLATPAHSVAKYVAHAGKNEINNVLRDRMNDMEVKEGIGGDAIDKTNSSAAG